MSLNSSLHMSQQNILNNYEESWAGYSTVQSALESMTFMAQHINDMKRKHEHLLRIQEVQSLLYGWDGADLTTFGELVLEVMVNSGCNCGVVSS